MGQHFSFPITVGSGGTHANCESTLLLMSVVILKRKTEVLIANFSVNLLCRRASRDFLSGCHLPYEEQVHVYTNDMCTHLFLFKGTVNHK